MVLSAFLSRTSRWEGKKRAPRAVAQRRYWDGIRAYESKNRAYLQTQIGNPDGDDKPNKKFSALFVWPYFSLNLVGTTPMAL